ncbi:hypothetical protein M9458_042350 [Cirrhinus mrigala]|uniref:Uncharacterized protein n=1 Tax=Cirrhinus mrigala TaxID=683832 RepID=A0ABD0NMG9_CIRMR
MNSSMQPDLTVSRTYTGPICFPDSLEKELIPEPALFDPLPDLKVKVHSSFMVAEYHAKAPSQTFPRGVVQEIGGGGGTWLLFSQRCDHSGPAGCSGTVEDGWWYPMQVFV